MAVPPESRSIRLVLEDYSIQQALENIGSVTGLDYMNSGGIGLLVTLLVRANRQKQKLLATGLNDHYKQIFELTRLDEAIVIHDTEAAALAASKA